MKRSDQISIIGFGSMGSMLAEGFLRTNTLEESRIKIFTRTRKKTNSFVRDNPDVIVCNSLQKCVEDTSIIIICIPPNESINVLHDIKQYVTANQIIVSIIGSLTIDIIQKILPQKIVRMVPSITAEIDEGTFIISSNDYCSDRDTNKIYRLFSYLGEVIEVPESKIEIFTDLTSCSPGILSAIFQEYINSAIRVGKVSRKQALKVFIQTLYGLSKLYYEDNNDFEAIISRVARKGGTTEIGINLVQENLPGCFDKIFIKTLEHQKNRKEQLKKSLT